MRLKKYLISPQKAQSSLEYFIVFALIVVLALSSFNTFLPRVRRVAQGYFEQAVERIKR